MITMIINAVKYTFRTAICYFDSTTDRNVQQTMINFGDSYLPENQFFIFILDRCLKLVLLEILNYVNYYA